MIFPNSKRKTASDNLKKQLGHLKAAVGDNNLNRIACQIDGIGDGRLYKLQKQPELMTYGEQYHLSVFFQKHGLVFDPTLGGVI